jgi:hypothetical protein
MNKLCGTLMGLTLLLSTPVHAQFGGLLGGSKPKPAPAAASSDPDAVLTSGLRIIVFSTIATDLAVASSLHMLEAFPPEKVEAIRDKFIKYNELKGKRGEDGQLDTDSATLSTEGFQAMGDLKIEDYQKGKSAVVRSAYLKMGLAMGADLVAATALPTFVTSTANAIGSLKSNPFQAGKVFKLVGVAKTIGCLVTNVPAQIGAIRNVRAMAKTIAEAEGVKLGEPEAPTTVDPDALTAQIKTVSVEG